MKGSQESSQFCPVIVQALECWQMILSSKLGVLWEVGMKEASLGWGDVGWLGLLISFQSEGKAEDVSGASFKIHFQSAS